MLNTELKDRTLWYDGDITIKSDSLLSFFELGENLDGVYVDSVTPEIKQYNKLVPKEKHLGIKTEVRPFNMEWNIPQEYKNLNVEEYVFSVFDTSVTGLSPEEVEKRATRIAYELACYKKLGLYTILRTIIFIINRLDTEQIVWGVGRGSSVSSYVLFVLGVHDVDSVLYDLDIHDFLRL